MDRKSEVFLNLINAFVYQVEAGEAYAQTPNISLDDIEYVGFTLIVGAGDSGTYNCHAYGYEADGISHIMTMNAGRLMPSINAFASTVSDDENALWKTCILEIPEDIGDASADFLHGRDAEPWLMPSLRISEFVRPGNNADKDHIWNQNIYQALHGIARTEALPKKRYIGAIEDVVQLSASDVAELDETLSSAIEELFSNNSDFVPAYLSGPENTMETLQRRNHKTGSTDLLEGKYGNPEMESMFAETDDHEDNELVEPVAFIPKEAKESGHGLFSRKGNDSKPKWGLGRKKLEVVPDLEAVPGLEEQAPIVPVVEELPKKFVPEPKIIPKNDILPSFIKYSEMELAEKRIQASMASIIIYLQPPVITSYGFWYAGEQQGHWMPEGFDLDDTMDAFLRDTIPDPKNHWDVCIVRMNLETNKVTTEFLKGRPAYTWMEPMSHRSKSLSEIAKYRTV